VPPGWEFDETWKTFPYITNQLWFPNDFPIFPYGTGSKHHPKHHPKIFPAVLGGWASINPSCSRVNLIARVLTRSHMVFHTWWMIIPLSKYLRFYYIISLVYDISHLVNILYPLFFQWDKVGAMFTYDWNLLSWMSHQVAMWKDILNGYPPVNIRTKNYGKPPFSWWVIQLFRLGHFHSFFVCLPEGNGNILHYGGNSHFLGGWKKHQPLAGCPTLPPCWSHLYQAYAGELDKIKHLGTIVSGHLCINM